MACPSWSVTVTHQVVLGLAAAARARSRASHGSTGPSPGISPGRSASSSRVTSGTVRCSRPANPAGTAPPAGHGRGRIRGRGPDPPVAGRRVPDARRSPGRRSAAPPGRFRRAAAGVPCAVPLPTPAPASCPAGRGAAGGGAGVLVQQQVEVGAGPQLIHATRPARPSSAAAPTQVIRWSAASTSAGGSSRPASAAFPRVLRPPLHPGVLRRLLPPLPRLLRRDLHHRPGDRGAQPARGQPPRPVQHLAPRRRGLRRGPAPRWPGR